ncbi:hypothetical protein ACIQUM_07440 [Amycolatopsis azurea]|uniref:hypothetical protein n=1 Tax=Amycolatopsis azurea TaxID=36819 RepID=UPI0037F458EC
MMRRSASEPEPLAWNPPRPRELAGIREDLVRSTASTLVHENTALNLAAGLGTISLKNVGPRMTATVLLSEERRRLTSAHLWSISDEMTQVSISAGRKLPSWKVQPDDVPSPSGLMMFDTPLGYYRADPSGQPARIVSIVAASWGPTRIPRDSSDHLWVTFWSLTDHDIGVQLLQQNGYSAARARRIHQSLGDFSWDNEVLLTYGSPSVNVKYLGDPGEAVDPSDVSIASELTLGWIQTLRAAWLLQKQDTRRPITEIEEIPISKTMRKQLQRMGYNTDPVRVVTLHRRHRSRGPRQQANGYTVTVRSHISGHVRWQPYPSRGVIEGIWIDDHVRGPEGAPWSQRTTTVKRLDRPPGGRPPIKGK